MSVIELERVETAADVLIKAKTYLQEHGWCQGATNDGRVCAIVAIHRVVDIDILARDLALTYLRDTIRETGWLQIPTWNDASGRKVEDVYEALDRAIELANADN